MKKRSIFIKIASILGAVLIALFSVLIPNSVSNVETVEAYEPSYSQNDIITNTMNILPYPYSNFGSKPIEDTGLTFTINDDYSITINGRSLNTINFYYYLFNSIDNPLILQDYGYTSVTFSIQYISGSVSNNNAISFGIIGTKGGGISLYGSNILSNNTKNSVTWNFGANNIQEIFFYTNPNIVFDNYTIRPVLNFGTTKQPFIPNLNYIYQSGAEDGLNGAFKYLQFYPFGTSALVDVRTIIYFNGGSFIDWYNSSNVSLGNISIKSINSNELPSPPSDLVSYFEEYFIEIPFSTNLNTVLYPKINIVNQAFSTLNEGYLYIMSGSEPYRVPLIFDGTSTAVADFELLNKEIGGLNITSLSLIYNSDGDYLPIAPFDYRFYINIPGYSSYNQAYNFGYTKGESNGLLTGEKIGYQLGFEKGNESGYNSGYNEGYNKGLNTDKLFFNFFSAIIDAPVSVFTNMFNIEILGVNMSKFAISIFSIALLICVVRLFI